MKKIFALAVVALIVVLAACRAPAPAGAVIRVSSQRTTGHSKFYSVLATTFPTGIFMHKQTPGRGLHFLEDGRFFVLADGKRIVEGTYSVKDDVYTEESNNYKCPVPTQFNWTFDGLNLKFQPLPGRAADSCDARNRDFNDSNLWESVAATFPRDMYKGCTSTYCGQ